MLSTATNFMKQFVGYREMWVMLLATVIGILVVNGIKNRPVDHSWKIASAVGAAVCVIVGASGNISLGLHLSYGMMILSGILGILVGLGLEVIFFSVDYSRTENVQFEDDEYYYYVKAVPKVGVPVPEKQIKRITDPQDQENATNPNPSDRTEERPENSGETRKRENFSYQAEKKAPDSDVTEAMFQDAKTAEDILLTRSLSKELGLDQKQEKK